MAKTGEFHTPLQSLVLGFVIKLGHGLVVRGGSLNIAGIVPVFWRGFWSSPSVRCIYFLFVDGARHAVCAVG